MDFSKGHIILYDGYCNLCNATIHTILKFDKHNAFQYLALQSEEAKSLLKPKFDLEKLPDSVMLFSKGEIFIKSEAIFKIIPHLGKLFKVFYFFRIFPLRARDHIYDFVAKNRYNWFGRSKGCSVILSGNLQKATKNKHVQDV
ncbi:MAG: DCC1-like thiol-disulfide oxidoreductase family protein [Bacteroidales bacterium]